MATILQQPDQYSFAGNIKNIIVTTEARIIFKLKHGSEVLFESSYDPDLNDKVEIDIKKIIQDALTSDIPGVGEVTIRDFPSFSFIIDEGAEQLFYAFEGGVDSTIDTSWFAENFLTWQPQTSYVTWSQPQFLSYIALQVCNLKIKGYFSDGTDQTVSFGAFTANKINTANLQFSSLPSKFAGKQPQYVDVWTEDVQGARLSYIQIFVLKNSSTDDNGFLFKNSLGGWDSVVFSGTLKNEASSDVKTFSQEDTTNEYQVDLTEKYSKNTGYFLSEKHRIWVSEFFKTSERYFLSHRGYFEKLTVLSSTINSVKNNPSSYNFTFSLARTTKYLNLPRVESPESPIEIVDPTGELFFLAPRLVEFPDAEFIDELIIPAQSPYLQAWKKFSLGALKSWIATFIANSEVGISSHSHTNKSVLDKITAFFKKDDAGTVTDGTIFSGLRIQKEFLRKDVADTAAERIAFSKGIESTDITSPEFTPGLGGTGFSLRRDAEGRTYLDIDELLVRQSAKFYELIIQQLKHQGGIVFYTAASMEVLSVTEQADSYRCFFDTKQGQLTNEWAVNDQARCQRFAGKYYWRLVTAVGTDYIDLSKADTNGAGVPEKGDVIVQLGNRTDTSRQAAKVTTVIGVNSPRDEFYEGINSFDLTGKLITIVGMKDGKAGIYTTNGEFAGKVAIGAGSTGLTGLAEWAGAALDIQDAQSTANQAVQAAAALQNYVDSTLHAQLSSLQEQIDGQVVSWDFPYAPTLSNFPASEWTTDVIKDRHIHDTFYNNQPFVDNETTPDAGKAWRFTKSEGVYFWNPISDSDAVKALADAARAQDTADGKKRVFVTQPTTPYDVGDLWTQGTSGELMRCINQRLSGAYVAGDWEKAVKYTDDTAVNNLQVGGRNYFLNSKRYPMPSGGAWYSDSIKGQVASTNYVTPYWPSILSTKIPVGTVVTFSISCRLTSGIADMAQYFDTNNGYQYVGQVTTEWQVLKLTRTVITSTLTPADVLLHISGGWGLTYGNLLLIEYVKLEIGNKATDWTPAPEDIDAKIQDQQIYVEYSIDGSTNWHTTFSTGDIFMRQKKGSGDWSAAIRIVGEKGDAGNEGRYTDYQFAKNTSSTTAPTSNWQDAPPAISVGEYVWMRVGEVIPPATEPASWSAAVRITGDKGDTGPQGVPGNPGADGVTTYTWIRYADTSAGVGISNDPTGKAYIGFAYNKTTAVESNNPADYSWSLIKGEQGNQGVQGPAGADGATTYTWIKYSDNADGTGLYDTPTANTLYIGIAVNKTTATESTVKTDYVWSKFKGEQGIQGIPGNPGADGVTYYTWVKYADTPTAGMSDFPSGKAYLGIAYNKTTATESENYADYSWSLIKGTDGQPGADGADGQTLYTWIKYADTPTTGISDSPTGKTYIGIAVNKTTSVESTAYADYTWSLIKGADGKSVTATDVEFAQTTSATVAPTTGWQTTAPAWVDGQYIWTRTKTTYSDSTSTYSAAVNLTGAKGTTGNTGSTGTGVDSITEEYYLSTSKTSQTGGSWSTTPPTWSSGKYVWTRVKIVYKNPASTVYTTAVVSSEWEAVNELQIGGRNYLSNSKGLPSPGGTSSWYNDSVKGVVASTGYIPPYWGAVLTTRIPVGTVVTFSISCRLTAGSHTSLSQYFTSDNAYQYVGQVTTEWQVLKLTRTIVTSDLTPSGVLVHLNGAWGAAYGNLLLIEYIKLEIGNKATDWTPAPEDVDAKINTAQSAAATAQATADVAAAKTEGFTEIEGGLVTTNIIKLMDALAAAETAGINGMKGNGSNPAFWAGGTYAQALAKAAAIVLQHNGAGKIGDLIIEENGTVVVKEPATGQIRVVWNATELPLLADLLSQSQISDSEINSAANRTTPGTTTLANALVVTKANSKLTFDADISGYVNAPSAGTALISVAVNLYKDGVLYTPITSFNFRLQNPDNPSDSFTETIDFVLNSVPVGTYSVTLEVGATSDGSSDWVVNATLGASTLAFLFEQDIQQVRYGLDGWMAFYSASKFFYLTSKSGVPFLKIRGELDLPGLRGSGSVSSGGYFSNGYGKASNSAKNSTGLYTITHALGHINYGVNLTIVSSNGQLNAVVTAKNTTSFDVRIVNASNNTLTDSAFDFSIYGTE